VKLTTHFHLVPPWRGAQLKNCEIWSLSLSLTKGREHRLRVLENRVLRRIFGLKREEVAEGWRRLHNEELHNLYASPNVISVIRSRMIREAEYIAPLGEVRNAYNISVGKPQGRRPLERLRRRWEDNITMDLREIEWEGDCIHVDSAGSE
jgi:hypothetical protein